MRHIAKKRSSTPDIPMASTSDIAFLLIIFFLVSTVFRKEQGLKNLSIPEAEATERILKRRNVANVWIAPDGRKYVNDNEVLPASVTAIMLEKVIDNPDLVVMLQADERAEYGHVNDVLEALKEARALKVTFATDYLKGKKG